MVDQEETKDETEKSLNQETTQSDHDDSSEFQSASINPKQVFVTDEELKDYKND